MPKTIDLPAQQIPAHARQFAAECQLAAAGSPADAELVPVHIAARTAEPLNHWYWGPCVHDLDGVRTHKSRLALDYCHDDAEVLGYLDTFQHRDGALWCDGQLALTSDRAREVLANHKAGVPYEASIAFDTDEGLRLEYLQEGMTAEVNGRTLAGPMLIFREWSLRGVAICPHGYDKHTHTEFCAGHPDLAAARFTPPDPAPEEVATVDQPADPDPAPEEDAAGSNTVDPPSEQDPATPADAAESDDAARPPAADAATDEPTPEAEIVDDPAADATPAETPPADPAQQRAIDGAAFVAAFGETRGARYFVQGLSLEAARAQYTADLESEVAALQARLAALGESLGDEEAASFADGENSQQTTASGRGAKQLKNALPDRLAAFALGLRLPGRR